MTRRPKLVPLEGGRGQEEPISLQEARAARALYAYELRVVRAEPRPDPNPPRTAA